MRKIFKIHSLLGLISGTFILIFSLTGAIIVFWDEIEALSHGDLIYVQEEVGKPKISLDEVYNSVRTKYPDYIPYRITQMYEQGKGFEVGLMKNDFEERFSVYVHPYNGRILGKVENSINHILIKLHYTFYLGKIGELLAGVFALSFLGSIITGTIVYRKYFFKALLFRVKIKFKNWRTASSDLHRVLGVWALLFNFILALSGFWLMLYAFDFKEHFKKKEIKEKPQPLSISLNNFADEAKRLLKDFDIKYISLPREKNDALEFMGDTPGDWFYGDYNNSIYFNAQTGKVEKIISEKKLSSKEKIEYALYTLHFGQYGGLPIKILYCFFGLASSIIPITGFLLWWRKLKKDKKV